MSAFEVMWKEFYEMVTNSLEEKSLPLKKNIPYYVLVESMGSDQVKDEEHLESLLQKALEDSVIIDAVLAKSEKLIFPEKRSVDWKSSEWWKY